MTILFIRHSESKGNKKNIIDPGLYSTLTSEADFYINLSKDKLINVINDIELVISSPALRTIETSKKIFAKKQIQLSEKIIEFDFGNLAKKEKKHLIWADFVYKKMPDGESIKDVYSRSVEFFCSLDRSKNIAVVTHGAIIASILHYIHKVPLYKFPAYEIDYCGFILIEDVNIKKIFGIRSFDSL